MLSKTWKIMKMLLKARWEKKERGREKESDNFLAINRVIPNLGIERGRGFHTPGISSWWCSDTHGYRKRRKLNASASEMTSATTAHFLFLMGEIRSRSRHEMKPSRELQSKRVILSCRRNGITQNRAYRGEFVTCTRLDRHASMKQSRLFQKVFVAFLIVRTERAA